MRLGGTYVKESENGVAILNGNKPCSPEEFAAHHFERKGYTAIFTESVPFHALFGIFMWLLIQDPSDPKVSMVGFGDRVAFDQEITGKVIYTFLPDDFGKPGYALRRANAIDEHFNSLPEQKEELLWVFDYWIEPSADLRQYLWAHRPQSVAKAREIVSILPVAVTRRILEYLVADYWKRYCGWPDMIVHNQEGFFFA